MKNLVLVVPVVSLLSLFVVPAARAQERPGGDSAPAAPPAASQASQPASAPAKDDQVHRTGSVVIGDHTLTYDVTSGTLPLRSEDGKERARIFFVAYTVPTPDAPGSRPVTVTFNGGPGSSSVWLHLGAFGPKRVELDENGVAGTPPGRYVDNDSTILDLTDLVFIDPVTTGYSRAAPGESASQFHGVREDVQAVGDFIRLWTTKNRRWLSPKYVAGESYGTTRAAALAESLGDRLGMYLNGVILISTILDFGTTDPNPGNDLPHVLMLPSFCATAAFHGKLDAALAADLPGTLKMAEAFALGEYRSALDAGDRLDPTAKAHVVAELSRYTGLSASFLERSNLRVELDRFAKELLRDRRRTVGRLDSRFLGIDADAAGANYEYDSSYANIQGAYTAAWNEYVRAELGYENDLNYEILTGRVHPWRFGAENRYVNVAQDLRSAMNQNPHLKVFVAGGLFDLATPYFAADYTMTHLGLEPEDRGRVVMKTYDAGHMLYIRHSCHQALKRDLAVFYGDSR